MITYVKGDATSPIVTKGSRFIVHVCNDAGGWGSGFVLALSKKWEQPEKMYRSWHKRLFPLGAHDDEFRLGGVQSVWVQDDLNVVNMIAQHGYGRDGRKYVRYVALAECLDRVANYVRYF